MVHKIKVDSKRRNVDIVMKEGGYKVPIVAMIATGR